MSIMSKTAVQEVARKLQEKSFEVIDAPVSGGQKRPGGHFDYQWP